MAEVNSMDPALLQQKLTPTGTLTALVQAPVVLNYLDDLGVKSPTRSRCRTPSSAASPTRPTPPSRSSSSPRPSPRPRATARLTEADAAVLTQQLQALNIDVNPRYGTFNPQTASIELTTPGWVTPQNAAQ